MGGRRQRGVADFTYTALLLVFSSRLVERAPTPFSSSTLISVKVSNRKHITDKTDIL